MTIISQLELARRIAQGSGCLEKGCTMEFVTEPESIARLNPPFENIEPGDAILLHVSDLQGDKHTNMAHFKKDHVMQLLDDDDMEGMTHRLHLMEHCTFDHEGKSPPCTAGHEMKVELLQVQAYALSGRPISADMLFEAIKELVAQYPELREKLAMEYGDSL